MTDEQVTRARGTGTFVRNAKGEPVGVKIRHPKKGRITVFFRPSHCAVPEDVALREAEEIAKLAKNAVPDGEGDTVTEYFGKWVASREARGVRDVRNERGRFRKWVEPRLGLRPIASVTTRELEELVSELDEHVRRDALAWKTAILAWSMVAKMFDDAHRAKDLDLRVRQDNPARDVRGPDRGAVKARAFLFPRELLALADCVKVPLWRRRIYVFANYTGLRAGEIRALEWSDVHEADGYIHVNRSVDSQTRETKTTKTGRTRRVPCEPELVPLLEAMREQAGGEGVVFARMPHESELPWMLRLDLKAAGVERAELHEDTDTSRKLTAHDLRHGYGTWRAIRGDDLMKISRAMGHSTVGMTEKYVNEADAFDLARFGVPFGALPKSLWSEFGPNGPRRARSSIDIASPAGFEHSGNPVSVHESALSGSTSQAAVRLDPPSEIGPSNDETSFVERAQRGEAATGAELKDFMQELVTDAINGDEEAANLLARCAERLKKPDGAPARGVADDTRGAKLFDLKAERRRRRGG